MANIDLDKLSLQELKEHKTKVEAAIANRQKQEYDNGRQQILEIAKNLGVSVEALLGNAATKAPKGPKAPGKPVAAKYRNPADATQEWTGRGRQPKWITAAVEGGKKLEDFAIKA